MRLFIALMTLLGIGMAQAAVPRESVRFIATAYSVTGITAKGTRTHRGVVAADPRVLPLGSVISVAGAGRYSGVYVVTDTGAAVTGHHIDIFMPRTHEAPEFGKKLVIVRVIVRGDNRRDGREITGLPAPAG
jgi:3D (Asp-Asp-Asp) domain-containing protein